MNVEAFIIHLSRAQQRRRQVEKLRQSLPMPVNVVDAVDGSALTQAQVDDVYVRHAHDPRYPFDLRRGEIGCFLSHRNIWNLMMERGFDAALIMEDDVDVNACEFEKAFGLAESELERFPYIQLLTRPIRGRSIPVGRNGECVLSRCEVVPLKTAGQLVSKEAAERLARCAETFDRPVDTFLQMPWVTGTAVASIYPSGLSDCTREAGGSTIGQGKPLIDRLAREVKRWRFRRSMRIASQRYDGSRT